MLAVQHERTALLARSLPDCELTQVSIKHEVLGSAERLYSPLRAPKSGIIQNGLNHCAQKGVA